MVARKGRQRGGTCSGAATTTGYTMAAESMEAADELVCNNKPTMRVARPSGYIALLEVEQPRGTRGTAGDGV